MSADVVPFLMFEGCAAEAAQTYAKVFEGGSVTERLEGDASIWVVKVGGLTLRAFDSPIGHDFGFTPAISLFATCDTEDEVRQAFAELSEGGDILMPLDRYPFSACYGWLSDRFGVSWQIGVSGAA